jgi:hypothetical protein
MFHAKKAPPANDINPYERIAREFETNGHGF